MPNASFKSALPFPLRNFFTFPGPDKCAAANIPDSVISNPFITEPTNQLISFLRIHLFTLQYAMNTCSCNSGLCKKCVVL